MGSWRRHDDEQAPGPWGEETRAGDENVQRGTTNSRRDQPVAGNSASASAQPLEGVMEFLVEFDIDVPDGALGSEVLETVRPPRPPPRRSWRSFTRQLDDADVFVAWLDPRENGKNLSRGREERVCRRFGCSLVQGSAAHGSSATAAAVRSGRWESRALGWSRDFRRVNAGATTHRWLEASGDQMLGIYLREVRATQLTLNKTPALGWEPSQALRRRPGSGRRLAPRERAVVGADPRRRLPRVLRGRVRTPTSVGV